MSANVRPCWRVLYEFKIVPILAAFRGRSVALSLAAAAHLRARFTPASGNRVKTAGTGLQAFFGALA